MAWLRRSAGSNLDRPAAARSEGDVFARANPARRRIRDGASGALMVGLKRLRPSILFATTHTIFEGLRGHPSGKSVASIKLLINNG